jgi:hypothetical protein
MKLQLVKGIWNGFDFYYFYLDRIYRIVRNFFACGEGPFGRRPHYPNDPVDPETSFQKLALVLSWATLHFVGWVELTPNFVGFRCTQPNLHFAGVFAKCETQQQPISELSP